MKTINFSFPATNGVYVMTVNSSSMDRVVVVTPDATTTQGNIAISARPPGSRTFIPIDGVPPLDGTEESIFTMSYPVAEIRFSLSGFINGSVYNVTVSEGSSQAWE